LDIKGYNGRSLKNTFFKQTSETKRVALVFPGLAYNSTMPLLHYSVQSILASGINVLTVDYDYSNNAEFMKQSMKDRYEWMADEVEAVLKVITEKENQDVTCLTGKSLGTLALGYLLEKHEELRDAKTIWLTPLIKNPELMEQMLSYMKDAVMVIGTTNHSLEIEGNVTQSLRVLMQIVTIVQQFLI
jgi:hypothetical protein